MAEVFKDSFDHYATAQLGEKWSAYGAGTSTASIAIGAYGRNSTNGLRIAKAGAGTGAHVQLSIANLATLVCGFSLKGTGADLPLVELVDNATVQCSLYLRSDGRLEARGPGGAALSGGTGSAVISSTVPKYVEIKPLIHASAGTFVVKVDGTTDINVSGADTLATANVYATLLRFGETGSTSATYTYDIDDLYVYDTTGGVQDDFAGDHRIECIFPSGAGSDTDFTPSTGSNFQNVDDTTPDDDSTYNSSATVGHVDTFAMGNLSSSSGTITSVSVVVRARKEDAGARTLRTRLENAAAVVTTQESGDLSPSTSYAFYRGTHRVDGDGNAFVPSDINGIEAGYEVQA